MGPTRFKIYSEVLNAEKSLVLVFTCFPTFS